MRFERTILFALILVSFRLAWADDNPEIAITSLRPLQQHITLFAQVLPQHLLHITPSIDGRVSGLTLTSGSHIRQGETIARISGSMITAKLNSVEELINKDISDLSAAKSILAIKRKNKELNLATHIDLLMAQRTESDARYELKQAEMSKKTLMKQTVIQAPSGGVITAFYATNGDYIKSGQALLSLLPDGNLWLSTRAYGQTGQRLKIGQSAKFFPPSNDSPIALRLASKVPVTNSANAWQLYWLPSTPGTKWFSGEVGTLKLKINQQLFPAIPTQAMIMDQGKWWVMIKTKEGKQPVHVIPEASHNGWTWIKQGLIVGQEVILDGAYQAFHHDFSEKYANPD